MADSVDDPQPDDPELPFVINVHVRSHGYGRRRHQLQQAHAIAQALHTAMGDGIEVRFDGHFIDGSEKFSAALPSTPPAT